MADRARRVLALSCFLSDITEWGWADAPARKLLFRDDIPKTPQTLPRYLPVDVDRRITATLIEQPDNELAAMALRLQQACGLRIGEPNTSVTVTSPGSLSITVKKTFRSKAVAITVFGRARAVTRSM